MAFLDMEEERKTNGFVPLFYYMAQLTAEVRRSWVSNKHRTSVRLKDFLLKFSRSDETAKPRESERLSREEATRRVKSFFFALTGLSGKKPSKPPKRRK